MLLLLLLATAASQPPDEVVARVGSQSITAAELTSRLAPGADRRATLEDLVNDTALSQEAQRAGYGKDARVRAEVDAQVRKLAGEAFLVAEVDSQLKVDDRLLSDLYHSQNDSLRLRLIVVPSESDATALLARLAKGASFATEAANSIDPAGKARGGDQGLQVRGQFPTVIQELAFRAPLQQPTGPVKLELGWGVIQVLERTVAAESGLAAKREKLRAFAEEQGKRQLRSHYLGQLRKQAGAVIDEPFIESTGKRLDATPAEEEHAVAAIYGKPLRYREILPGIRRLARGITGGHFSGKSVKLEVAGAEVNERALQETAMRKGFGTSPAAVAALPGIERDALTRAFADDLRKKVTATDAEVAAEYQRHSAELVRPGHRSCSHILSATEKEAEGLRARLAKGEKFEELAQEASRDVESAAKGGLIGDLPDDRLDAAGKDPSQSELVRALRTAPAGVVSGPVKSGAGWHLVRCAAHAPAVPVPLAEVAPQLRSLVVQTKGNEAVKRAIDSARATSHAQLDEAALQRVVARKD